MRGTSRKSLGSAFFSLNYLTTFTEYFKCSALLCVHYLIPTFRKLLIQSLALVLLSSFYDYQSVSVEHLDWKYLYFTLNMRFSEKQQCCIKTYHSWSIHGIRYILMPQTRLSSNSAQNFRVLRCQDEALVHGWIPCSSDIFNGAFCFISGPTL